MELNQLIAQQNAVLSEANSIYRFKLVGDNLIDVVDIQGNPTCTDEECRYINRDELVSYTNDLIEAQNSYM